MRHPGWPSLRLPPTGWYDFLVPVPDPISRQFLDMLAAAQAPAMHELPPVEAREMAVGMRATFPETFEAPAVEIENRVIPNGPNGDLAIRILRPPGLTGPLPAVMFFHGGGWVLCDFSTHRRLAQEIAVGANAAVVFVEYSRSPEVRFPVANEEAYFATRYIAENGHCAGTSIPPASPWWATAPEATWRPSFPCWRASGVAP